MRHRWGAFGATVAAAAVATSLLVAPASASGGAGSAHAARGSNLKVTIAVQRFARTSRGRTIARGIALAKLNDYTGKSTTLRVPVTLSVSRGGTCRILTLTLNKLHLTLLGLNVDLSKVNLTVTGQRRGGVLGSLFCALARSHVASSKAAAIHALNAHLRHRGLHPMGFTVPLSPKTTTSQTAPCPVLNLVLGPLHLNLLGLVVDLNQVTLTITATPGGGALGDLFCSLSH
jgi:hypothetical protein